MSKKMIADSSSPNSSKPTVNRRLWSEQERQILIDLFPDNYTFEICKILTRSYSSVSTQSFLMGLKKSDAFKNMELQKQADRLKIDGAKYHFQKGREPENKGKPMSKELYDKCKCTMFKKGQVPHNGKADWEEILKTTTNGKKYLMIKLPTERKLKPKHIWLWENQNGKVKKGFNIIFKDGNQLNCVFENLECLSNAELMAKNTIHRFPSELKSTIRLVKKLKRTINEKQN